MRTTGLWLAVVLVFTAVATPGLSWADAAGERAERLALASKLFRSMQGEDMTAALTQMASAMAAGELHDAPPEQAEHIRSAVARITVEVMPDIFDAMAPVYADAFTTEELRAMVDFYDSEIGRSIMRKTIEVMPAVQEAMVDIMPQIAGRMIDALCEELSCTPAEKREMRRAIEATTP